MKLDVRNFVSHWIAPVFACAALLVAPAAAQSLTTDRPDYHPGELAQITGAGFGADETVTLQVLHSDGTPSDGEDHMPWNVVADSNGAFVATWHVCEDDCFGSSLLAIADGHPSGLHAEVAFTDGLGSGRLSSVVPLDGGCVNTSISGSGVESWNVQQGRTYHITLTNLTDCASGGTAPTVQIVLRNHNTGNTCLNATRTAPGVYEFNFTLPVDSCLIYPISYCTSSCSFNTGNLTRRSNGAGFQSLLRASVFDANCNFLHQDEECGPECCPPTLSGQVSDQTFECPHVIAESDFTPPQATASCGSATLVLVSDVSVNADCTLAGHVKSSRTKIWKAVNNCGDESAPVSQTISVADTTAPAAPSAPANEHFECAGEVPAAPSLSAMDACAGQIEGQLIETNNGGAGCATNPLVIHREWFFTDDCGNRSSVAQEVTVADTLAPVAPTAPASGHFQCAGEIPAAPILSAMDNCSGLVAGQLTETNNGGAGCATNPLVVHREWIFTDACGNSSSVTQDVTVADTLAPVPPAAPASGHFQCTGEVTAAPILSAMDNCSGLVAGHLTETNNGGAGCATNPLVIHREWSFTDACGNSSSVTQDVTVADTLAPVPPAAPASGHFQCTGEVTAAPSLSAMDNCSGLVAGQLTETNNGGAGCATNPLVIHREWLFTDTCGNSCSVTQDVTVADTTAPVAPTAPAAGPFQCSGQVTPAPSLSAMDNCSGLVAGHLTETNNGGAGCASNPLVIHREWLFTDACGNSSSVTQDVTVADTIAPVAPTAPANANFQCAGDVTAAPSLSAMDNCSGLVAGQLTETNNGGAGCATSPLVIHRVWRFTDSCGNSSSVTQDVTVADTLPPTLGGLGSITVTAGGACCGTVNLSSRASANDNCGGSVPVQFSPDPVNGCFPIGITTVTATASDACGNHAIPFIFQVTVKGRITATKFYDANANGQMDLGELFVPGWQMQLRDSFNHLVASGLTDASGSIGFDVAAGTYTVSESTANQSNWAATTPTTSGPLTVGPTNCNPSVLFGNYCFSPLTNGLTLGFWSNKNGQKILNLNPGWVALLNGMGCLRNANGSLHTFSTVSDLNTWLLGANATNMAYMLSAQLAANVLDGAYNNMGASTTVLVPGRLMTSGGVQVVPFLSVVKPITAGTPPLLAVTSVPGSGTCGVPFNNGVVSIGDLRARAKALLIAYGTTTSASTQRTYQECVKNLLDMLNNNGNNGYPCGPLTQFPNQVVTPGVVPCVPTFPHCP